MNEALLQLLTGHGVTLPIAAFVVLGFVVFQVASRLARHADVIADATGLGRLWVGTVLLAAGTSLPELTTDINAAVLDVPNIGVGDLMGSTLANLLVLATLDLLFRHRRMFDQVAADHVLVGTIAVLVTAIAGAAVLTGGWGRIGHVGIETLLIAGVYLLGMRAVYGNALATAPPAGTEPDPARRAALRPALEGFGLAALGLLVVAPLVVLSAEAIAIEGNLTTTFVGTLLVGFTTSLPEVAATFAAMRMGAFDLAVGNIFGSSAFNMCILLAMDVAYRKGPLLAHVSPDHALSALFALLAVALGMLAVQARRGQRLGAVRIESVLIVLTYAAAGWFLAR